MSSNLAIKVEGLGKQYSIGANLIHSNRFAEAAAQFVSKIFSGTRSPRKQFWALRDISFELERGAVLGIIGGNGAGKSTLLKLLSRISQPTEGSAKLWGRIGCLLEVGTGFHPDLSGLENIYLSGSILGMSRAQINTKVEEIIEFSGVREHLETPIKRYSSGMYMRLAFSVAAHLNPEILIVDEVLAVGDMGFQRKCLSKMGEVAKSGRTVLLVSHNMSAIKRLATKALVLDKGTMQYLGNVDDAISKYLAKDDTQKSNGIIPHSYPRPVSTGEGYLRRIQIMNAEGELVDAIFMAQPFKVSMEFEIMKPISDLAIEVGISTQQGDRILTATNVDNGVTTLPQQAGKVRVDVELNTCLFPGEYAVDVYMHHYGESKLTIDWVDRATFFTAMDVSKDGKTHHVDFSTQRIVRGYVRPGSKWSYTGGDQVE